MDAITTLKLAANDSPFYDRSSRINAARPEGGGAQGGKQF
jgi:hypothetical protein